MLEHVFALQVWGLSKNGEKFLVEVNLSSFVVDEEIYYAAILRDMSQPNRFSTSSALGRNIGDKELRIKKKVNITNMYIYIYNVFGTVGFACWSNNEIYSQINKS